MEDGDLWQAYVDADPVEEEVTSDDEILVTTMDSDNATTGPLDVDVSTMTVSANNVDVGPPVNIYAEAHRHAQIKAKDASDDASDDANKDSDVDEEESNSTREGPHASLHLSSELKQNQKKLTSDDNNAQVSDTSDENNSDGAASTAETAASDQEAAVDVSAETAPKDDDTAKESTKAIDDDITASTTETTSESDSDATKEENTTTKQPNRTRTVSEDEEDDEGPAKIILVDYASKLAGAQVLEKSPSFKGASNLLTGDSDKYAIAPCEDKKYVVIGLSEDILVKQIKLSNFERYSSHVREFQVLASQDYPAPSAEYWTLIGTFEANTRNGEQTFDLEEPAWARYLKFKFKSHFGAEHYCTLSQIKVHGSTMLQGFHEQWIESEKELEQEKENQQQHQQQQQQGEVDDGDALQQQKEIGVVEDKMGEESRGLEKKSGANSAGGDDVSQQAQPEPIVDSVDNESEKKEEIVTDDASPDKEISEGESQPIHDEVIESDHSSSSDANEEPTGKGDETLVSSDDDESISHEEIALDQEVVTEVVPPETTVDDKTLEEEEHDKNLDRDPAKNDGKAEQLSETNVADEANQADSDEKVVSDEIVADAVEEEESVDATPNAPDIAKTDGEATSSGGTATANDDNGKDDTESSKVINEGHNIDVKNSNEPPDTTNKTNDVTAATSNPNPASTEKKTDDAKSVSPDSGVSNVQESSKGDTNSNIKEPPSKSTEKDAVANTSSPVAEKNDGKVAAATSAELVAKLSKRFPHASCIKDLDFYAFKKRTILSNAGQIGQVPGPKGSGQVPGPKMEPIFAKITNEIKSVQMTQHQYEQYISAVKSCYGKLFLDMANDLDSIQRDYDSRLSQLEDVMSNIVPGALSKPRDYRLMAITSLAALSDAEYAQLALFVGFAMLMMFFRMRRKKTNLKKPSNPIPKSSARPLPAKNGSTPPVTPSSSAEVSPSSINSKIEGEPSLQHEILENGRATGNQPALVRIISEEKENTRAAANRQG